MNLKEPSPNAVRKLCTDFLLGEFIGLKVRVKSAGSKDLQGIEGKILDETQGMFLLETRNGRKLVPKKGSLFYFPESGEYVNGSLIAVKPEDRTKKLARMVMKKS